MQITTQPIQNIRFDPANGTYEALVVIETAGATYRYPCGVTGDVNLPLEAAAGALAEQAMSRHKNRSDLYSFALLKGPRVSRSGPVALPRAA
ncbi:MAG: hypothetical protein AAF307_08690 [Pseudomonadota bacterium]